MFEIQIYLRKYWGEVEPFSEYDRYFSIHDKSSVYDLFSMYPNRMYNYGKVVIRNNYLILAKEECELDFFISCIQDDKEQIFSGKIYKIDNSYFKLTFHYHEKLKISFNDKSINVSKKEFIDAFRTTAEIYYTMLAAVKEDSEYYENQAMQVHTEWQQDDHTLLKRW